MDQPRATMTSTPTRSACEPAVPHVGRLFRTWAGLPGLGIAGPRADEKAQAQNSGPTYGRERRTKACQGMNPSNTTCPITPRFCGCVPVWWLGGNYYHRRCLAACRRRVGGLWSQNPPWLLGRASVACPWRGLWFLISRVVAQSAVHLGGIWVTWSVWGVSVGEAVADV